MTQEVNARMRAFSAGKVPYIETMGNNTLTNLMDNLLQTEADSGMTRPCDIIPHF